MSNLQYEILDKLYFVESFASILAEVPEAAPVVADEIKTLIHKRWIQVMQFDAAAQNYVKTEFYNSDNMHDYFYLITKEGLFAHNGR